MGEPRRLSLEDVLDWPEEDDHLPISRREFKRMNTVLIGRLERIENLCFEDEVDEKGKVIRPSLETIIKRVDVHLSVLCDYARWARKGIGALIVLGGIAFALARLGVPLPWQ